METVKKTIFRIEISGKDNNERIDFDIKEEAFNDINKKLYDGDVNKDYLYTLEIININDKGEEDCGTILIGLSVKEYQEMTLEEKQKIGLKY